LSKLSIEMGLSELYKEVFLVDFVPFLSIFGLSGVRIKQSLLYNIL